jgi:selenocysteine lyase/cysteine desulfurase
MPFGRGAKCRGRADAQAGLGRGIATFSINSRSAQEIQHLLAEQNANVGVTSVGSTRLDMEERGLESIVRASVHYYNTENEVERFCRLISQLAGQR